MRAYEKEVKIIGYSLEFTKEELLEVKEILKHGVDRYNLDHNLMPTYDKLCYLVNGILEEE